MLCRMLSFGLATLALTLLAAAPVLAEKNADKGDTHVGKVVKAGDGKLTMTGKNGQKEHTHAVAEDAKITCGGKVCKLEDLKEGFTVKVTLSKDTKSVAKVEAQKPKDNPQ